MNLMSRSFLQIYEQMLHPVLVFDIDLNIQYVNQAAKIFYEDKNKRPQDSHQTLLDFDIHLKDPGQLEKFKDHLALKTSFNRNSLYQFNNGKKYQVEMNITRYHLDGEVFFLQQYFNVKPAAYSNQVCKIKPELLYFTQTLLDNVPIPFFYKNMKGHYIGCNKAFEKIIGKPRHEIINCTAFHLFKPEIAQIIAQYDAFLINGQKEAIDYQMTLIFEDDTAHELFFSKTIINKAGFLPTNIVGVMLDLSETKQKELLLCDAKNAAEAAVRAKSEFLENMSHELRTPMNATMGMTAMLLVTELDEEQREYADLINQENHHLLDIIDKILNYSRYTKESFVLKSLDFSLRDLIYSITDQYQTKATQSNLELRYMVQNDVPELLLGDANCLSEILKHLLDNAFKFTKQGFVSLTVNLSAYLPQEKLYCLRFNVQDTGIGIDKDKQQSIFDAFNQADNSRVRQYGGIGLGLSLSARLISLMKGVIWLESEVNQGSTFRFTAYFKESELI